MVDVWLVSLITPVTGVLKGRLFSRLGPIFTGVGVVLSPRCVRRPVRPVALPPIAFHVFPDLPVHVTSL